MNTNALRQKILDLAIHGKLVKQDPSDESATILLEKIRAEKEKKIASGELKRGKNDSYIFFGDDNRHYEKFADGRVKDIEDEIPFVVPEGWAWCRLGEIYYHTTGKALKKSNEKGSLKKYITTSNLYWDTFDFSKVRSMYFTDEELDKCTIKKGDLVVCNGGDVGRAAIWNYDHDICYQNHVSRMRPKINGVENRFFLYVLMFYKEQNLLSGKGIGISSLSASDLLSAIVPLPPTNQQRLIVSEIQKIFTQINLLEQNKVDLQTAVKQAKSKILDLAIRGKLVPQDPADEPARVMLEKLRAEKEAKIVAGEIKRGKNDSYIYKNSTDNCYYQKYTDGCEENISDEIPFTVPEGWMWCRLGEISSELGDGIHGTPEYKQNGSCYFINGNNLSNGKIIIKEETKTVGEEQYRRYKKSLSSKTMFVSINGTLGSIAFYNNEHIILGKSVCYFNLVNERLKYFFYFLLNSQYFQKYAKEVATGSTIKNVSLKAMNSFLIPLPPLFEQQRIVTKIEELFAQLDFITTTLTK
ncbi:restriction endonuclease subunit S [Treponema denticola]